MSDDAIGSIIVGVPVLWVILTIVAWIRWSDDRDNDNLAAITGALIDSGVVGLLGGCGAFALTAYSLRDDPYGLPGLAAIPGIVIGVVVGAVAGAWIALRSQ